MIWVWQAFWRLSNTRPVGFNGPLRIPISEVEAYCRLFDYECAKRHDLLYYIERLDGVYMKWAEEQRPKNGDDGTPPPPPR